MAKKKLYSLLVGIDKYHPVTKVNPLSGCVNDISNFRSFLWSTYKKTFDLKPEVMLRNDEATYENVVKNLGDGHLGKAAPGDSVLFYFSGHGTQEPAAKAFKPLAPNGLNEALICYDSGKQGNFCLADKELRILLHDLQQKGVHLTVIF
ncbi:MAG: caspase family protein, partial [Bacteroidota bacterium]